ncbi:hypothetical protein C8Q79DRAFT_924348 [Trametes meyenii]|nr:hypothetical protein C8Q79DRAFT_924348 [Trametes meyenii]
MAKGNASDVKPAKLAKKKSQSDLHAEASVKTKKTKHTEESTVPSTAESSSPKKKEKKAKSTVVDPEAIPAPAKAKAGKKSSGNTAETAPLQADKVEAKGDTVDKKKRKSVAVAEKGEESSEKTKKKRRSSIPTAAVETATETNSEETANTSPTVHNSKKGKAVAFTEETSSEGSKKKKAKAAPKQPSPEPEQESVGENDITVEEEEEQEFYGFSDDDDDSSDDEMVDDIPGIDIGKLPTIAKDDATVKRKLEKAKRKPTEDRGVICLGRIPHGFFEDQMRAYFSQFGTVTRLRLSRNKKTGKSKHYAFIEFDSSSVAQIVAETMDNYLLTGHILTCKLIPKDQVHPELWVGANRKWRPVPRDRVARIAHNKPRTDEEQEKAEKRLLKRQEQRKRKLEDAGIKYDFEAVAYKKKPKPTEA